MCSMWDCDGSCASGRAHTTGPYTQYMGLWWRLRAEADPHHRAMYTASGVGVLATLERDRVPLRTTHLPFYHCSVLLSLLKELTLRELRQSC